MRGVSARSRGASRRTDSVLARHQHSSAQPRDASAPRCQPALPNCEQRRRVQPHAQRRLVWAAAMGRGRGAFGGEADGDDSDLDEPAESFDDDEDMVTGSFDEPADEEEDGEEEFGARASRFDDDDDDDDDVGGSDADQDEPVGSPDAAYDSVDDEAAASDEEGAGSLGAFEAWPEDDDGAANGGAAGAQQPAPAKGRKRAEFVSSDVTFDVGKMLDEQLGTPQPEAEDEAVVEEEPAVQETKREASARKAEAFQYQTLSEGAPPLGLQAHACIRGGA